MKVYTYSQARQKLAKLLDEARLEGEVAIKKRGGETFILKPVKPEGSPLDIEGVNTGLDLDSLNSAVRESRERM
ncbi:MAG: type II toxin-antitoxin system prevent-host-death family antitoxin [Balneolaceae bacterium]